MSQSAPLRFNLSGCGDDAWSVIDTAFKAKETLSISGREFALTHCSRHFPGAEVGPVGADLVELVMPKFEPAAWIGEGLPPVGETCEIRFHELEFSSWNGCIILAHGSKKIFIRDNCGDEWAHSIAEVEFRPFRTPEQIAAEELIKERDDFSAKIISDSNGVVGPLEAMQLFGLGYRKQEA